MVALKCLSPNSTIWIISEWGLIALSLSHSLYVSVSSSSFYCVVDTVGFSSGTSGTEPACQCRRHNETWIWSRSWEDPLEKGMAAHSSILARGNPIDRGAWWALSPAHMAESQTWPKQHNTAQHSGYCVGDTAEGVNSFIFLKTYLLFLSWQAVNLARLKLQIQFPCSGYQLNFSVSSTFKLLLLLGTLVSPPFTWAQASMIWAKFTMMFVLLLLQFPPFLNIFPRFPAVLEALNSILQLLNSVATQLSAWPLTTHATVTTREPQAKSHRKVLPSAILFFEGLILF